MHIQDYPVLLAVVIVLALAVRGWWRRARRGGCAGCTGCAGCKNGDLSHCACKPREHN